MTLQRFQRSSRTLRDGDAANLEILEADRLCRALWRGGEGGFFEGGGAEGGLGVVGDAVAFGGEVGDVAVHVAVAGLVVQDGRGVPAGGAVGGGGDRRGALVPCL